MHPALALSVLIPSAIWPHVSGGLTRTSAISSSSSSFVQRARRSLVQGPGGLAAVDWRVRVRVRGVSGSGVGSSAGTGTAEGAGVRGKAGGGGGGKGESSPETHGPESVQAVVPSWWPGVDAPSSSWPASSSLRRKGGKGRGGERGTKKRGFGGKAFPTWTGRFPPNFSSLSISGGLVPPLLSLYGSCRVGTWQNEGGESLVRKERQARRARSPKGRQTDGGAVSWVRRAC